MGSTVTRRVVLTVAAIYFLGPLAAATWFTVKAPGSKGHGGGVSLHAYGQIFAKPPTGQIGFTTALVYSLLLSTVTIVLVLALMLPTQLLLHLRLPRWRPVVEMLSLLPLVFPPIVLVVGVFQVYEWAAPPVGSGPHAHTSPLWHVLRWMRESGHPLLLPLLYGVLALPFVYRTIDAGLRSVDVTTLVEAARNLGAGWGAVLLGVVVPALRGAVVNAAFLCFALVMGEYTISVILGYNKPLPVWLATLPTDSGQVRAAVSVFSLLLVEAILLAVSVATRPRTRSAKGSPA